MIDKLIYISFLIVILLEIVSNILNQYELKNKINNLQNFVNDSNNRYNFILNQLQTIFIMLIPTGLVQKQDLPDREIWESETEQMIKFKIELTENLQKVAEIHLKGKGAAENLTLMSKEIFESESETKTSTYQYYTDITDENITDEELRTYQKLKGIINE